MCGGSGPIDSDLIAIDVIVAQTAVKLPVVVVVVDQRLLGDALVGHFPVAVAAVDASEPPDSVAAIEALLPAARNATPWRPH